MKKLSHQTQLLVFLSIMLIISVACAPPATPVPPTAAPSNSIQNIVWQWTSVTNQTTQQTTTGSY
jgi:predicted membrane protein